MLAGGWPWIFISVLVLAVLFLADSPTSAQAPQFPAGAKSPIGVGAPQQAIDQPPRPDRQDRQAQGTPAPPDAGMASVPLCLTPDSFGYTCKDESMAGGPVFQWIDVSTSGTPVAPAFNDEEERNIFLPWNFTFYGATSNVLRISDNGAILFNQATGDVPRDNTCPLASATLNNLIAVAWDDFGAASPAPTPNPASANIYYQFLTSPNRAVIQWHNVPHYNGVGAASFEVILYQGTNHILFQYLNTNFGDPQYNDMASASVGIRNGATVVSQYACNEAAVPNLRAIQFYYPSATSTPTRTNTPSATLTPDAYEPNDTMAQAYVLSVGGQYTGINFVPNSAPPPPTPTPTDVDYFQALLKEGHTYEIYTVIDNNVGLDTYLRLKDSAGNLLAENDDREPGNLASRIVYSIAPGREAMYFFEVTNIDPSNPRLPGKTYRFAVIDLSGTPGPSPTITRTGTPAATQIGGLDPYEPNYDFEHAYPIGAGTFSTPGPTYAANFVPWQNQGPDNDFYMLTVKPGDLYTCETFNLSALADTNMIFYDANQNGIGGNDDVAPGDRSSRLSYYATYLGPLYILIGNVGPVPPGQASQYTYSLRCTFGPPPTPTPLPPTATRPPPPPVPTRPPAPPPTLTPFIPPSVTPPVVTPTPLASATPMVTPTVQVIIIPVGTPTPGGPNIRLVTVDLEIYYDANGNATPDPGEGIINLSARLYDETTDELLAYGFTDPDGQVSFTVPAPGPVRLEVPYLNYVQVIDDVAVNIQIRVVPQPLPGGIP
jgi:hypothetical protein